MGRLLDRMEDGKAVRPDDDGIMEVVSEQCR